MELTNSSAQLDPNREKTLVKFLRERQIERKSKAKRYTVAQMYP